MPAEKSKSPQRFVSGVRVSSGSVANRVTELWAGSALVNSPSFGAVATPSRAAVSVTVTGLTASHLVVATPGSMPGACVFLISACAIIDAIETTWAFVPACPALAAAGCAITLNYIAYRDAT